MKIFNIALGDYQAYEKFKYPAGELQVRLLPASLKEIHSAGQILLTARISSSEELIEACLLVSALKGCLISHSESEPSKRIALVLPYLPYARADRRFVEGDCFGLETFAHVVNGLEIDVYCLDAHSSKAPDLVRRLHSLTPELLIQQAIRHNLTAHGAEKLTLLFPDEGAKKRYGELSQSLSLGALHCSKVRDKVTGKLSKFSVPEKHEFTTANVLLIDDICDGGGTFIGIAEALKGHDLRLSLYVTHGIFSKGLEPLTRRFDTIYTTDSFAHDLIDPSLIVYQVANLFEQAALPSLQRSAV
ncbi:MAG TPA: hypothetical protein V6C97_25345 [Oculatellaceae cyanobacterium]